MQGRQLRSVQEKFIVAGASHKILKDELNAHLALSSCPDFKFERTTPQNVVEKWGHMDVDGGFVRYEAGRGRVGFRL